MSIVLPPNPLIPAGSIVNSSAIPVYREAPCDEVANPFRRDEFASFGESALYWYRFGFKVIPITPGTKQSPIPWDPWLEALSPASITAYWAKNRDHEIAFIVGDDVIVFDTDSKESNAALVAIEQSHVYPNMVVKTTNGSHHYFRLATSTYARSDSHSTEVHPNRIDVKTGRGQIILPPSIGKSISLGLAKNSGELIEVGQDFIDAIFKHNGRPLPRPSVVSPSDCDHHDINDLGMAELGELLEHLDPDSGGYDDWVKVLMAIFHETNGKEEGLDLANQWSSKGAKYKGIREIETKWRSFTVGRERPVTIATLYKMASDAGANVSAIRAPLDEFLACETITVEREILSEHNATVPANPLDKFSLLGQSRELEKDVVASHSFLGELALLGQSTIFYARPNTGKTLITLHLLIEAITNKRVSPDKVYYFNMDDSGQGLAEKARVADEFGFHIIAEGHRTFSASLFVSLISELVENDQARGVVVILDTLKKVVDLMDKGKSSNFTKFVRNFTMKGGTFIGLGHTNKNPGRDGKPVYGGTSDMVDDVDCAYVLAAIPSQSGQNNEVVEFDNIKCRGNVVDRAAYSYCKSPEISYEQKLASVQLVDAMDLAPLKQAEQLAADADVIRAITACIREGNNTKMKMAGVVAKDTKMGKGSVIRIIDKYTGDDPALHRWQFSIGERGANIFTLLNIAPPNLNGET